MIRINLIPPEILGKRKDERRRSWVWLGGAILLAVAAMFALLVFIQVASSRGDVAAVQQQAEMLQAQTSRFDVFQQKEAELGLRKASVAAAIAGRVDWAEMLYELGLVLPTDVYLTTFNGTDGGSATGAGGTVTLAGVALPDADKTPAIGYKSVAKVLVRLTEMTQLENVWLTSANASTDAGLETTYDWSISARVTPSRTPSASVGQ